MTTIDFPDHLACVIYTQGCPLRCGYCQNTELIPLVPGLSVDARWTWTDVVEFLRARQGLLEAVVISGGEPLIQPYLPRMVKQVKTMGFKVGLHTAGISAAALSRVIDDLDWVGLDIKAPEEDYARVTGRRNLWPQVEQCLQLLLQGGGAFECRTTVDWHYHTVPKLRSLAQYLSRQGVTHYAVQQNHGTGCLDPKLCQPLLQPVDIIAQLQHQLDSMFRCFTWRT